jgi:hypothetical protein
LACICSCARSKLLMGESRARLAYEPVDKALISLQFAADNGSPQRYASGLVQFPKQLSAAIKVVCVGAIRFSVAALALAPAFRLPRI